jgi:hypothetical protein
MRFPGTLRSQKRRRSSSNRTQLPSVFSTDAPAFSLRYEALNTMPAGDASGHRTSATKYDVAIRTSD